MHNYIPSRVVVPSDSSKDQRVYIKVYAPDYITGQKKLKRFYKIPGANKKEQIKNAQRIKIEIDSVLKTGASFDKPSSEPSSVTSLGDIIESYRDSLSHTRSAGSRLTNYLKEYIAYCENEKLLSYSIYRMPHHHGRGFLDYLKSKPYKNRTINNKLSYAKAIWNYAIDSLEIDMKSPFHKVKKLKQETGRNLAFQPDQIKLIKEQHKLYPDLSLLAMTMYYTLARTNEIANMKVKHIGMYQKYQIYIPASTGKTGIERHIIMPEPLIHLFERHEIFKANMKNFIFGSTKENVKGYKTMKPDPRMTRSATLGEKYSKYILKPLGFDSDYTLYSWKHTGVVNAKLAGISDADIMQQTGHKNFESYSTYLKSLGLFARGQYAAKVPEI